MNPAGTDSIRSESPGKRTVLIVDDTPENLTVLGELLQQQYRVRAANSGERALRAANSPPRPDLILLDVSMPKMDGQEVLRPPARTGRPRGTSPSSS